MTRLQTPTVCVACYQMMAVLCRHGSVTWVGFLCIELPKSDLHWLFCFHGRTFSSLRTRTLKRDGQKMVDLVLICLVLSVILHLRGPWNAEDVTPESVRGPLPEVTTAQLYNNRLYIVQRVKLLKQLWLAPLNFANTVRPNWQISYSEHAFFCLRSRLHNIIIGYISFSESNSWSNSDLHQHCSSKLTYFLLNMRGFFCLILSWVINRFTFSGPSWMVAVCNYWAHSVLIFFSWYLAQSIWRKQRPSSHSISFRVPILYSSFRSPLPLPLLPPSSALRVPLQFSLAFVSRSLRFISQSIPIQI